MNPLRVNEGARFMRAQGEEGPVWFSMQDGRLREDVLQSFSGTRLIELGLIRDIEYSQPVEWNASTGCAGGREAELYEFLLKHNIETPGPRPSTMAAPSPG